MTGGEGFSVAAAVGRASVLSALNAMPRHRRARGAASENGGQAVAVDPLDYGYERNVDVSVSAGAMWEEERVEYRIVRAGSNLELQYAWGGDGRWTVYQTAPANAEVEAYETESGARVVEIRANHNVLSIVHEWSEFELSPTLAWFGTRSQRPPWE